MVGIEQMHRGAVFAPEADAVLDRHHLIAPSVYDGRRTVEQPFAQRRQSLQVECRRHEKRATGVQQRRRRHRHIAAETGADQHQVARQRLTDFDQLVNAAAGSFYATIVDRLDVVALAARDIGQRRDFSAPRDAVLAMRENDVAIRHP